VIALIEPIPYGHMAQ